MICNLYVCLCVNVKALVEAAPSRALVETGTLVPRTLAVAQHRQGTAAPSPPLPVLPAVLSPPAGSDNAAAGMQIVSAMDVVEAQALKGDCNSHTLLEPLAFKASVREAGGFLKASQSFRKKHSSMATTAELQKKVDYHDPCGALDPETSDRSMRKWHEAIRVTLQTVVAANGGPFLDLMVHSRISLFIVMKVRESIRYRTDRNT